MHSCARVPPQRAAIMAADRQTGGWMDMRGCGCRSVSLSFCVTFHLSITSLPPLDGHVNLCSPNWQMEWECIYIRRPFVKSVQDCWAHRNAHVRAHMHALTHMQMHGCHSERTARSCAGQRHTGCCGETQTGRWCFCCPRQVLVVSLCTSRVTSPPGDSCRPL